MVLNFRHVATAASIVCFSLAVIWLVAPWALLGIWKVDYSYSVGLMARRGAALFLGISVMFWLMRHCAPSPGRSALMKGFLASCLMLATLGLFELCSGHAGIGILTAVIVETAFALTLMMLIRGERIGSI